MDCMVARERTAGARRECLAQVFGRHVPDGREVRRCVGQCVGPERARDGHGNGHFGISLGVTEPGKRCVKNLISHEFSVF